MKQANMPGAVIIAVGATVAGPVAPGTSFSPAEIADHYWRLHAQPHRDWEREVLHTGK